MSLDRTLDRLNIMLTNINNMVSNQVATMEKMLDISKSADWECRRELFKAENLPEYWDKLEQKVEKTKNKNGQQDLKKLLKDKPVDLVPTSVEIIVGCGGGGSRFRRSLARYIDALTYKYSRDEDYVPANYVLRQRAKRKYIDFLYELSKDYLVKNDDIHELNLSAAIAVQQVRIVAQQEAKKVEKERE